jgi:hypothetical protein
MSAAELRPGSIKASRENVLRTADRLLMGGTRPTQKLVQQALGGGSPNSITEYLNDWYRVLGERLQAAEVPIDGLPRELVGLMREIWRVAQSARHPSHTATHAESDAVEQSLRAEIKSISALHSELRQQLRVSEQKAADARALALRLEATLRDDRAERERLQTELAAATQELEVTRTRFALAQRVRAATTPNAKTNPPTLTTRTGKKARPPQTRKSPTRRTPPKAAARRAPPRAAQPRLIRLKLRHSSGRRSASTRGRSR